MIDRFLARLLFFARTRRGWIGALALVAVVLSGFATRVPLDFSFAGVMDRQHPEVERYFEASRAYGLGGVLPLLIEGPEEVLDSATLQVSDALESRPEVRRVSGVRTEAWMSAALPWLVSVEELDRWGMNQDRPAAGSRGSAPGDERGQDWLGGSLPDLAEPEGARLLQVVMARDTFEIALDADDFPTIRRLTEGVLEPLGVTARFAGMPAIVTQEKEATLERMTVLGPLSLLLVMGVLLTVERRLRVLLSIAVPMLLAVGCTLAIVGAIAGNLSLMESIFGVLVFGLGIDFAVHLLLRMREERSRGLDFEASLRLAFVGTGRGVMAGGLTTAGAFFILALAPDPVFYRLGLSGGLGLLLCLLFLLLMLPAQWAWIESTAGDATPAAAAWKPSFMGKVATRCAARPAWVLGGAAVFLLLAMLQMQTLRYETNLERVFSRDIEAVEVGHRIHELFGVHPGAWVVAVDGPVAARETMQAFVAEPLFDRSESAASYLPVDATARREVLAEWQRRGMEGLAVATGEGGGSSRGRAEENLQQINAALAQGPPTLETLPESIRERLIGPKGEWLVWSYPSEPSLDSAIAAKERRVAQAIHPAATSMNALYEALVGTDRPWLPRVLIAVGCFVAGLLWIDLGSLRSASLALAPAGISLVATLGGLAFLGVAPNTVTLVAFPLLLGLGVDDGIHVVHRMLEQPHSSVGERVDAVARGIALTTATTCGSVALLLFSRHPGIESVALVLLLGLPVALVATVTVVPALAVVWGVGIEAIVDP